LAYAVFASAKWLTVVSYQVSPRHLGNTEVKNEKQEKEFKSYPTNYNEQGL
jgi:hypothetical protein